MWDASDQGLTERPLVIMLQAYPKSFMYPNRAPLRVPLRVPIMVPLRVP